MKKLCLLIALFTCSFAALAQSLSEGGKMTFQGSLFQNGEPFNGTTELTFSMELTGGTWTETISGVEVANGLYAVVLGNTTPIPIDLFLDAPERVISVTVDGTVLGEVSIYPSPVSGVIKVDSLLANRMIIENEEGNYVEVANNFYRIRNRLDAASSVYLTNGGSSRLQLADYDENGNSKSLNFFIAGPTGNSGLSMSRFNDDGSRNLLTELYSSDLFIDGTTLANGYARGGVDFYNNRGEQTSWFTSMPGDLDGGDPDGWSAGMGMYGTNSINFVMEGKKWENNDLGAFSMFGEHTNGDGWYNRNIAMNVNSDGTNNSGQIELFKTVEGAGGEDRVINIDSDTRRITLFDPSGEEAVNFDGNDGSAFFQGGVQFNGDVVINGTLTGPSVGGAPSVPDGGSFAINDALGTETVKLGGEGFIDIKGSGGSPNIGMGGRFWEGNNDLAYFNLTGNVQVDEGNGPYYPTAFNMNVINDGVEQWVSSTYNIQESNGAYNRPMARLDYDDLTGTGFFELYDTRDFGSANNLRLGVDGGGLGYLELKGRSGEFLRVDANGLVGGDINPSSIAVNNPNNGEELANIITQNDGSQLNLRGSVDGLQEGGGVSLGTRWFAGGPQRGYVHVRGTVNPVSYFDANLKFQMEAIDRGDGVETASFTMHGNELDGNNAAIPVLSMTTIDDGALTQWGSEISMKRTEGGGETETINLNGLNGSGYFAGDLTVDGNLNANINPSVGDDNQGVLLDNQSVNFKRGGDGSGNGDLVVSLNSFDDGAGSDWGALDLNRDGVNVIRMNAENADVNFNKDGEQMYIFPSGINAGLAPYTRGYVINMDATGGPLMEMYSGGAQTININGDAGSISGNSVAANAITTSDGRVNISSADQGNGSYGTFQLEAPSGSDDRIDMGFAGNNEQYGYISLWKNNGGGSSEYALLNTIENGPGGAIYANLLLQDDLGNSVDINGYGKIDINGTFNDGMSDQPYTGVSLQNGPNGGEIFVSDNTGSSWVQFQSEFNQIVVSGDGGTNGSFITTTGIFGGDGTGSYNIGYDGNATFSGNVNAGTLTADDGFTSSSDKRLKKAVKTIDGALEKTSSLRGVTYQWNKTAAERSSVNEGADKIGVIAQELEVVFPELVKTGKDGYKSVDYASLTAVLIEAIKELNAEVKTLKSENAELKAEATKTAELSKRIETIERLLELKADSSTSSAKH